MKVQHRQELIDVALGRSPADVYVREGNLVNVLTGEIYPADLAIKGDRVAAVGDVSFAIGLKTEVIEAGGLFVTPGLVDAHIHEYHTYLGVDEYTRLMVSHGVTAIADDLYGQGIVGGIDAIRFFKQALEDSGIRLIFLVPTIAYLQNRYIGLTPTPGVTIEDLLEMLDWEGCRGLSETPFDPIVAKWPELLDLFEATIAEGKVVTGHAADITSRQLQAYAAMGASTDHESVRAPDALAKARVGLQVLMRNGSMEHNVGELARVMTEHGVAPRGIAFASDVASAETLSSRGSIDEHIRLAISNGVEPIHAVQMATINAAEIFHIQSDIGSLAAGRYADFLLVKDLARFTIESVYLGGAPAVKHREVVWPRGDTRYPSNFLNTVRLPRKLEPTDLMVTGARSDSAKVRVIAVTDGQIVTAEMQETMPVADGILAPDATRDILLIAMADRHGKGSGVGVGFVHGFGLRAGAIASSVSTESANLCAVGANPSDMALAMNHVAKIGGGFVVAEGGQVIAVLELPILGLMSNDRLEVTIEKYERVLAAVSNLGCPLTSPFSQLEFCFAGGLEGALKLSDEGLMRLEDGVVSRVQVVVQ